MPWDKHVSAECDEEVYLASHNITLRLAGAENEILLPIVNGKGFPNYRLRALLPLIAESGRGIIIVGGG